MTSPPTHGSGPDPTARRARRVAMAGYTLLELALVAALIGLLLMMAVPRLMPALAWSHFEGAARHIASLGRSAMSYAALHQERITVLVDLDSQEYWAARWIFDEDGLDLDTVSSADKADAWRRKNPFMRAEDEDQRASESLLGERSLFTRFGADSQFGGRNQEDEHAIDQAVELQQQFDRFYWVMTASRARNVKHQDVFHEGDPLFERPFTLSLDNGKQERFEEILDALLERRGMPKGVFIDSVVVGGEEFSTGMVEIDVTPAGITQPVTFYVRDEGGEYYSIIWDAITGGTRIVQGKEQPEE